jgi:hypothetical protein
MIASISAIFTPISFRTFSVGKPFGSTIVGALRPAGMRPNPTTNQVNARWPMDVREASGLPFFITLSNPRIVPV